jgi:hypothetical protein
VDANACEDLLMSSSDLAKVINAAGKVPAAEYPGG